MKSLKYTLPQDFDWKSFPQYELKCSYLSPVSAWNNSILPQSLLHFPLNNYKY